RLAAHVPRGDPIATGRLDIHLDLDLWNLLDLLDALVDDPVDLAHPGGDLLCLPREDIYVRTEDAHDDRLVRPAQHLLDPLPEICLHGAVEAWIAVDHSSEPSNGLVVVGVRVEVDPLLVEVDAVDLVPEEGLSGVRRAVLHCRAGLLIIPAAAR